MASRSATALGEYNHIIDATFSNIEQFERFDRYTTLQSLPVYLLLKLMVMIQCTNMESVTSTWNFDRTTCLTLLTSVISFPTLKDLGVDALKWTDL